MWADRIAARMPWAEVVGVDAGRDFINRASSKYGSVRVRFAVEDFARLSFADGSFDCVYADNSLEHAYDVDATLTSAYRVLADGGVLVAAIPSDARNDGRTCDNHTWKTAPSDVHARLAAAGFVDIRISELDVFRRLGMAPYPPARNRMMFVRAWKRARPVSDGERALQLGRFVHQRLDPATPSFSTDLDEILAQGHAWCTGFAVAAGLLLAEERCAVRWVTLVADGPATLGAAPVDAHEVVEVRFDDGSRRVLDVMANVWFERGVLDLLRDPALADEAHADGEPLARGYDAYTTSIWYARVATVAVRSDPRHVQRFVSVADALQGARLEDPRLVAALRLARARASAGVARLRQRLTAR